MGMRTLGLSLLCSAAQALHVTSRHMHMHTPPSSARAVSMGLFDSIKRAFDEIDSTSGKRAASAAHILMKNRMEALMLKEQIDAREIEFEDAARRYSTCPSAGKGGSLGQFGPGQMAPAFDALVFDPDTQIGEVNLCATSYGTHLVKVLERSGVATVSPAELAAKAEAAKVAAAAAAAAAADPLRAAAEAAAKAHAVAEAQAAVAASPAGAGVAAPPRAAAARESPRDRMAKLSELLDANLISKDEYENKRKAILDSI